MLLCNHAACRACTSAESVSGAMCADLRLERCMRICGATSRSSDGSGVVFCFFSCFGRGEGRSPSSSPDEEEEADDDGTERVNGDPDDIDDGDMDALSVSTSAGTVVAFEYAGLRLRRANGGPPVVVIVEAVAAVTVAFETRRLCGDREGEDDE